MLNTSLSRAVCEPIDRYMDHTIAITCFAKSLQSHIEKTDSHT